jgi:multiple sugar transport system ATP-binding protein
LKAIHAKTKATTIFVTHDQSEAMSVADRIVIMREGEIEQMGTPEEVYEKSANMFVADFIGTPPTNFFDGEIRRSNGVLHLLNPHFDMALSPENTAWLQSYGKRDLVIGARPENILLVNEADALFSIDVLVVEPQGSHQVISFEFDGQIVKIVAPTHPPISAGERIHVSFDQRSLHFFDPQTTQAIYRPESS